MKLNIVSKVYGAPQTELCLFISSAGVCKAGRGLVPAKSEEGKCGRITRPELEAREYRREMWMRNFVFHKNMGEV